ncbi:MAG: DUF302 domain-containing protein [Candidatus Dadabacteria bacterium]|nr:MAG: DUF302 domain-containing protein [Candidatus Dadabacteria bacterium]
MFTLHKTVRGSLPEIREKVEAALAEQGFGVLTEIDVQATLKKKLGIDVPEQVILGACNPQFAHQALEMEPRLGALLPCNVVIRQTGDGEYEVAAIDPRAMMAPVGNPELDEVADAVRERLQAVVDAA